MSHHASCHSTLPFLLAMALLAGGCTESNREPPPFKGGDCNDGAEQACGSDVGACVPGVRHCEDGEWGECTGEVGPTAELCNGLDDDCDGETDNSPTDHELGQPCGTDEGECTSGIMACAAGSLFCQGEVAPADAETCNGLDDDCDGETDESPADAEIGQPCGTDEGECTSGTLACVEGELACTGQTTPGDEICDGLDNDCDGETDEAEDTGGCDCAPGQTEPCGTDEGECSQGVRTCTGGQWGECTDEVGPVAEACDGLDNDCDGETDEENPGGGAACGIDEGECATGTLTCIGGELVCDGEVVETDEVCDGRDNDCDGETDEGNPGGGGACGSDVGECVAGTLTCTGGQLVCEGEVRPAEEICDGRDNDCDGEVDETFPGKDEACGNDTGECVAGRQACQGGRIVCAGAVGPVDETCNGLDDDCDGAVDNGNPGGGATCGTDQGHCETGMLVCSGAKLVCAGEVAPMAEVCNGLDDDCDGAVDEEVSDAGAVCGTDVGECQTGTMTCSGGALVCAGGVRPVDEVCDGRDNDCDGQIDEGPVDAGASCGSDVGACSKGVLTCSAGQLICFGGVRPTAEVCDALDNDCDGQVDEGGVCADCQPGQQQACGTDVGECVAGTQTCVGGHWGDCVGAVQPAVEICDGRDNDCDGAVDEEFPGKGNACGSDEGECVAGTLACIEGQQVCLGAVTPKPEICNGLDDDCDAAVDEENPGGGGVCGTDVGRCEKGTLTCSGGALICAGAIEPVDERCNGIDDDCDGAVDEGSLDVGAICGTDVGECAFGVEVCSQGRLVCAGGVQPVPETCDGRDNDCDGLSDEEPLNLSPTCGSDVGNCVPGVEHCIDGQVVCLGAVAPQPEACDSQDNDCDGEIDEDGICAECIPDTVQPCGTDVGECVAGVQTCVLGYWDVCVGAVGPTPEICDGRDNDCDEAVDEEFPEAGVPCGLDVGECSFGELTCENGELACTGGNDPIAETCNGLDDDCNGAVDDAPSDVGSVCGSDVGQCSTGLTVCSEGELICDGDVEPAAETCNGLDDDCDGTGDDDDAEATAWCAAERGPAYICVGGACRYPCVADDYEGAEGNNDADHAWSLALPGEADARVCSTDEDFYRFDMPCTSGILDVRVTFEGGWDPDLDIAVLNGNGAQLASSRGTGSEERISVRVAQGSYLLRVYLYKGDEVAYHVTSSFQCGDRFEENDAPEQAKAIEPGLYEDLIMEPGDDDWFALTVPCPAATVSVSALFTVAAGNLDMQLFDAAVEPLAEGVAQTDDEYLMLRDLPVGTYLLRVFGPEQAQNAYRLRYAVSCPQQGDDGFEENDDLLQARPVAPGIHEDLVALSGDQDYFTVETCAGGLLDVSVQFTHADGDIDLQVLNAAGQMLRNSTSMNDGEHVFLGDLPDGFVYVQVYGYGGAANVYTLGIELDCENDDDAHEDNDALGEATVIVPGRYDALVWRDDDWFTFTVPPECAGGVLTAEIGFRHAWGNLDLQLTDGAGQVLISSAGYVDTESIVWRDLAAEDHAIRIHSSEGVLTRYDMLLTLSCPQQGDDELEENDMPVLAAPIAAGDYPGLALLPDDEDWYSLQTCRGATLDATIHFAHAAGNLELELYTQSLTRLAGSYSEDDEENVNVALGQTTKVLLRVAAAPGVGNEAYDLSVTVVCPGAPPDRFEDNDFPGTATPIEPGIRYEELSVESDDPDYYRLTEVCAGATLTVALFFSHAEGDIDLQVNDAAGTMLGKAISITDDETLVLRDLAGGDLVLKVYSYGGIPSSYVLETNLSCPREGDDAQEENDDLLQARVIGLEPLEGLIAVPGDADFYRIEGVCADGTLSARASFSHAGGNIDMWLVDAQGQVLAAATSVDDDETITREGLAAGTYYIWVGGESLAQSNGYGLDVDVTCSVAADWCRLQWPLELLEQAPGASVTVYGRVHAPGVTDASPLTDPHPMLVGEVGYGPDGSNPDGNPAWSWTEAQPNAGWIDGAEPGNDEYMADMVIPAAAGSPYDFAYRFSGDGGQSWLYCDRRVDQNSDGSADGYSAANAGVLTVQAAGQGSPILLFSEYVEGSSNNKAVEIVNRGGQPFPDLSACAVRVYSNGAAQPSSTIALDAVPLIPGEVYLLCHSGIAAGVLPSCDKTSGSLSHNGDDALELFCNDQTVDVIGEIGFDPGTAWGVAPFATADQTLRRDCGVTQGDANGRDPFDPAAEWLSLPKDTLDGLGVWHCAP